MCVQTAFVFKQNKHLWHHFLNVAIVSYPFPPPPHLRLINCQTIMNAMYISSFNIARYAFLEHHSLIWPLRNVLTCNNN